jgi:hypothetical protein
LRTVIIAPYRKAILVLCRFCRCVEGTRDTHPNRLCTTSCFSYIFINIGLDIVFHRCCSDDT